MAWDSDLRFVQCGVVSHIAHVRSAVRAKLAFNWGALPDSTAVEEGLGKLWSSQIHDRCEASWIEAGAAYEESVDLRLRNEALRIVRPDAAAV